MTAIVRPDERVLVAIIRTPADLELARDAHWYRIPVSSVHPRLEEHWPPRWLAFYQPKVFGHEAYAVRYYARMESVEIAQRWQLFPSEAPSGRGNRRYYKMNLGPLQALAQPIISRRLRRIVFIPTDWRRFTTAQEINDLFRGSPLEERLWRELGRYRIDAEREFFVAYERPYFLDFAIFCAEGSIDVETDGDTFHYTAERAPKDNERDNELESHKWHVLRFGTQMVKEKPADYCIHTIADTINRLGGLDQGGGLPRRIEPGAGPGVEQLPLLGGDVGAS